MRLTELHKFIAFHSITKFFVDWTKIFFIFTKIYFQCSKGLKYNLCNLEFDCHYNRIFYANYYLQIVQNYTVVSGCVRLCVPLGVTCAPCHSPQL